MIQHTGQLDGLPASFNRRSMDSQPTAADRARARKLLSAESLAMLEVPLTTTTESTAESTTAPLSIEISLRRARLALLVGGATACVVVTTVVLSHGAELSRFDPHRVPPAQQTQLLDRYNSYSGNVASAIGRLLEVFVTLMAQVLVLWLMTDSVLAVNASWRVRLTVLGLGATVGFLLTNSLNALNVQVRELPPTLIMATSDLSTQINYTNSSTTEKSFSESIPQNPATNTILRSLILPRASVKTTCNGTNSHITYSMQDDSITYAMPPRTWMKSFLSEALPTSTLRMDLLANTTMGEMPSSASVIADLLVSAVYTNSTYAPFDAVTPFNLAGDPQNNSAWYPREPQPLRGPFTNSTRKDIINVPTARLAGLLRSDPRSSEAQDREWLLAHVTEYMRRATSDDWQNTSALLRWTLDITRVNITPTVWVDAVTIKSEVRVEDVSLTGATVGAPFGTTTGLHLLQVDNRFPDAQVHGYAVCLNANGSETLYSTLETDDPKERSKVVCNGISRSSMYVFSSGRHFVADNIDYESGSLKGSTRASIRSLRIVYSTTFARMSWKLQDLSSQYNAACHADSGCMGLDATLSDSSQRLLVSKSALPLDELMPVKCANVGSFVTWFNPQQPLEIVLVRRPSVVKLTGEASTSANSFRVKYKDLKNVRDWNKTHVQTGVGDALLLHNIRGNRMGNKTQWDELQQLYCAPAHDRRIINYVNNHLYMETTLQTTYTAGAFFLFQNGVARDVAQTATDARRISLQFDGNIQEMSVWLSVPKLNATLTLTGCGLLVVALVVVLVRLHVMTATQDHKVTVTTPHQIARVMVDDTTFPSLLLKRHIHDNGINDAADQFVIDGVVVRSSKTIEDSAHV